MRQLVFSLLVCGAFTVNAQQNWLVSADAKAKQYTQKMQTLFELNEKQKDELYRLRFELSLATNLAEKKFETQPEKLEIKVAEHQERFEGGVKKALNKEQYTAWAEYKQQWKKQTSPVETAPALIADFELK